MAILQLVDLKSTLIIHVQNMTVTNTWLAVYQSLFSNVLKAYDYPNQLMKIVAWFWEYLYRKCSLYIVLWHSSTCIYCIHFDLYPGHIGHNFDYIQQGQEIPYSFIGATVFRRC